MKIIVVSWRGAEGGVEHAQFPAEKFLIRDSDGIVRIHDREEQTDVLWFPVAGLVDVKFGETKEEPSIITPAAAIRAIKGGNA